MTTKYIAVGVLLALTLGIVFFLYRELKDYKNGTPARKIAAIGVFGSMATILYIVPIFTLKLPFFPSFLSIHFDEIPVFFASFAYGPGVGFGILVLKTLIKLPFSGTLCVGELCDLILSTIFIIPSSIIYRRIKGLKGLAISLVVGTSLQIISGMILNVYIMIPFYEAVFGLSDAQLLAMMQKAMPAISNVGWSYAVIAVLPFNALKDALVIAVVLIIYKPLRIFIDRVIRQEAQN